MDPKPNMYWIAGESMDAMFNRIDSWGGWPIKANYLIARHCCDSHRPVYFSTRPVHDEMNSVLWTKDDYYWWKVSPEFKTTIRVERFQEFCELVKRLV